MDRSLSEQQEMLLFRACRKHGGTLPVKMAEDMYSSKSSGRSAIDKLKMFGYVELKTPGFFEVVKLPRSVKKELERFSKEESDGDDGDDESPEYESSQVTEVDVP